jgi:indolepyruvate ferredoxin oxidoreductase
VKRVFSTWVLVAFKGLARLKGLRGTRWDIFGYSAERRAERALPLEFIVQLNTVLPKISRDNVSIAIELFQLIDDIRGYGHIKVAATAQYRVRRDQLIKRLTGDIVQLVDIHNAA